MEISLLRQRINQRPVGRPGGPCESVASHAARAELATRPCVRPRLWVNASVAARRTWREWWTSHSGLHERMRQRDLIGGEARAIRAALSEK